MNTQFIPANSTVGIRQRFNLARRLYKQRFLALMLLPAVIATLIFNYIPIAGWIIAFVNYKVGKSIWGAEWVGLANFKAFFIESSDFLYVIRNTLVMNSLTIVINLVAALVFAILLKELRSEKFSKIVQMVSFFPFFISWVITYSVVYALFASTTGAVNETLVGAGIIKEGLDILGSSDHAWSLIISMNLWKYLGYNSIIFLATIVGIPNEQYEAADIDGANRFDKIKYITIPNLVPTIVVILIMNSGWILNSNLEQYFVFTNAINWDKMEVFDMYIYKFGLQLTDYSYATAVGIIRTIVSLVILVGVNKISKKLTEKAIF